MVHPVPMRSPVTVVTLLAALLAAPSAALAASPSAAPVAAPSPVASSADPAPVADTLAGTPTGNASSFTPGTYEALFVSPRNGSKRFRFTVTGQRTRTVTVVSSRNLAARASGAKVLSAPVGSRNPNYLIDGTESTGWGADSTGVSVDTSRPRISAKSSRAPCAWQASAEQSLTTRPRAGAGRKSW